MFGTWSRSSSGMIEILAKVLFYMSVLQCKYNATEILHTKTVIRRKLYQKYDKPLDNIIISMPLLVKEHYIKQYEYVCSKLDFIILSEIGVQLKYEHTYEHVKKALVTIHASEVTLYGINEWKMDV